MPSMRARSPCPPHYWWVDSAYDHGVATEHHRCPTCGAEKDLRRDLRVPRAFGDFTYHQPARSG
jgi:hypothetical protein